MHVWIYVCLCLCIFICLKLFHVSFRGLHPHNSSSRLLITKILHSLISCRYFSLSFPVVSFPPCCSSSHSRWLLLVYININQCLWRDESPKHAQKTQSFTHTHTPYTLHACLPQKTTHTPDSLMLSPNIMLFF